MRDVLENRLIAVRHLRRRLTCQISSLGLSMPGFNFDSRVSSIRDQNVNEPDVLYIYGPDLQRINLQL